MGLAPIAGTAVAVGDPGQRERPGSCHAEPWCGHHLPRSPLGAQRVGRHAEPL